MSESPAYIVRHIDLAEEGNLHFDQAQYYFVFWYKSIPLGQFYSSSQTLLTESFFWKVCYRSIAPALRHYAQVAGHAHEITEPANADAALIRHECKTVLQTLMPESPAATCPLSVIICTRDRADYLNKCLTLLTQQVMPAGEIIVVDNASRGDDTRNVTSSFRGVRYIREDRAGLDVARNTGARHARFELVAYTDDDTNPHRYWTYHICRSFDNPAIAAMTGLVIAARVDTEAQLIFEKYWPFNRGYIDKYYGAEFFRSTVAKGAPVWEVGAGANMAFRKSIFEKVGYFDERLDVGAAGCSGDSELWYRILAEGHTIHYNPRAVVHHHHRESVSELKNQLHFYMRGFTVAILVQYQRYKHKGNLVHLFYTVPRYYVKLLWKGFPRYKFQHRTLLSEISGIFSGLLFYIRNRRTDPKIFPQDAKD